MHLEYIYIFGRVCLSLCACPVWALTFESLHPQTSFFDVGTSSEYLGQGRVSRSNECMHAGSLSWLTGDLLIIIIVADSRQWNTQSTRIRWQNLKVEWHYSTVLKKTPHCLETRTMAALVKWNQINRYATPSQTCNILCVCNTYMNVISRTYKHTVYLRRCTHRHETEQSYRWYHLLKLNQF